MKWICLVLGLGMPLVAAPRAHAKQPPSRAAVRNAQDHFEKGRGYHEAGEYDAAISEFLAAYALVPRPALLFNVARSYEKKGDLDSALDYYQKVLLVQKEGELAVWSRQATERILQQQAKVGPKAPAVAPSPPPAETSPSLAAPVAAPVTAPVAPTSTAPQTMHSEAPAVAASASAENPVAPAPAAPPADVSSNGRGLRIAGISAAIAGAVVIGLGVKFALDAGSASDKLASNNPISTAEYPNIVADGESSERNMFLSYGIGGALLVGGGLLYYFGRRAQTSNGVAVTPAIGPSVATVQLRGAF